MFALTQTFTSTQRHRAPVRQRRRVVLMLLSATVALTGCGPFTSTDAAVDGSVPGPTSSPSASAGPTASPTPAAPTTPAAPPPPVAPAPKPTKAPVPPAGPPSLPSHADVAQELLSQLNGWRAEAGQPALTMTSGLVASAHKHNLTMAAGCGLQHQCSQEAAFGDRIKAQGVSFRYAAENIATGGRIANTTSAILSFAERLNTSMHDETPPNDGHRQNMLSPNLHRIGIDVVRDSAGNIWLTEDFAS